jgi:hypothetical protein
VPGSSYGAPYSITSATAHPITITTTTTSPPYHNPRTAVILSSTACGLSSTTDCSSPNPRAQRRAVPFSPPFPSSLSASASAVPLPSLDHCSSDFGHHLSLSKTTPRPSPLLGCPAATKRSGLPHTARPSSESSIAWPLQAYYVLTSNLDPTYRGLRTPHYDDQSTGQDHHCTRRPPTARSEGPSRQEHRASPTVRDGTVPGTPLIIPLLRSSAQMPCSSDRQNSNRTGTDGLQRICSHTRPMPASAARRPKNTLARRSPPPPPKPRTQE